MKKMLAIMLVSTMLLSLVACGNKETPSSDYTPEAPAAEETKVMSDTMDGTRTLAIYDLIAGNEFFADADMLGAKMAISRQGANVSFTLNMMDFIKGHVHVVDGIIYVLDDDTKTYVSKEATQEQLDKINELFDNNFSEPINMILGSTMEGSGKGDFLEYKDVYYEEISADNGAKLRYFFDGDDLLGVFMSEADYEMKLYISAEIPEDAFDIPEDYKEDAEGDFIKQFNKAFGEGL